MQRWPIIGMLILSVAFMPVAYGVESDQSIWMTDYDAALKAAAEQDKSILVNFTGSDWCLPCIVLHETVFDTETFKSLAPDQFVLLMLDIPRNAPHLAGVKGRNEELAAQFGIDKYPTILLLDAEGRVYGETGYREGGPDEYLAHLGQFDRIKEKRDEHFAAADEAKGVERARELDAALMAVAAAAGLTGYDTVIDEIIALDADNEAGLKAKYDRAHRLEQITSLMNQEKWREAVIQIEQLDKDYELAGTVRQFLYYTRARAQNKQSQLDEALESISIAIEADPDSPIAAQLSAVHAQLSAVKEAAETAPSDEAEEEASE